MERACWRLVLAAAVVAIVPAAGCELVFAPAGSGASGTPPADASDDAMPPDDAADRHDEDGDGTPDVTDRCPHINSPGADLDSDGDGIGDDCDPQPGIANTLVLFAGFGSGGTGGLATFGEVMFADDDAIVGDVSGLGGLHQIGGIDGVVVTIDFRVLQSAKSGTRFVFVNLTADETMPQLGSACYALQIDSEPSASLEIWEYTTDWFLLTQRYFVDVPLDGAVARMTAGQIGTGLSCGLALGSAAMTSTTITRPPSGISVGATNAIVAIEYVHVVAL